MPRAFTAEQLYRCDAEAAFALMCDESFLAFLIENSGGQDPEVVVEELGADAWRITLDRALPAQVPSFMRSLVGDRITVREAREWAPADADGSRAGTLRVTFDGAPAVITADLALAPVDDGSRMAINGQVRAAIPLVGGRIEEFAREQVQRFIAREQELAADWLTG